MADLLDALERKHEHWSYMQSRWARYRAFGGGVDSPEEKKPWLPKGEQEWQEDYEVRVGLTHDLGWTGPALRRMVGSLTKNPAERSYTDSTLGPIVVAGLESFASNADGKGGSIDEWFAKNLSEVLRMGLLVAEVVRPGSGDAITAADESEPFIQTWDATEVWDWEPDDRGALAWVKLVRDVWVSDGPTSPRTKRRLYRILTQDTGIVYARDIKDSGDDEPYVLTKEWGHGVGRVPVVEWYAFELGLLKGGSYIDEISKGDLRLLQLESDQSMASYTHGSPRMLIKTKRDLDEIAADTSHVLKLNPEAGEDAGYMQADVAGMVVRESSIERTSRQALNAAGIDPSAVTSGSSGGGRSGVSIAWQHSTSEEPILGCMCDAMTSADIDLHEIAARYLTVGQSPGPHVRVFDGAIKRAKKWDLMTAETAVDLADSASTIIGDSSPTWQRDARKYVAAMVPGNASPEQRQTYSDEIDAAAENSIDIVPVEPQIDESGVMLAQLASTEPQAMDPAGSSKL